MVISLTHPERNDNTPGPTTPPGFLIDRVSARDPDRASMPQYAPVCRHTARQMWTRKLQPPSLPPTDAIYSDHAHRATCDT